MKKLRFLVVATAFIGALVFFNSCSEDSISGDTPLELRGNGNGGGNNGNGGNGGNGGSTGNNGSSTSNGGSSSTDMCACINDNYPIEELSAEEEAALLQMREEEKLARDVYITLYDTWNASVFNNISNSEQQHMDDILCLLDKYGLEDPVGDNGIGEFEDADIQGLYVALVDLGQESLVSALTVGATIEDLDIFDLIELSQSVDNQDILAVFNDLTKGSRNHMRAFYGQLVIQGATYTPQYITQELFDSIINSDMERGGSICDSGSTGNNGSKGNKGGKGGKGGKKGRK